MIVSSIGCVRNNGSIAAQDELDCDLVAASYLLGRACIVYVYGSAGTGSAAIRTVALWRSAGVASVGGWMLGMAGGADYKCVGARRFVVDL